MENIFTGLFGSSTAPAAGTGGGLFGSGTGTATSTFGSTAGAFGQPSNTFGGKEDDLCKMTNL